MFSESEEDVVSVVVRATIGRAGLSREPDGALRRALMSMESSRRPAHAAAP